MNAYLGYRYVGTADGRLGILPLYPIRIDPFSNRKKKMGEGTLADCGGRHTASAAGALATVLILGIARRLVACIIWVSDIGSRSPPLVSFPIYAKKETRGGAKKQPAIRDESGYPCSTTT